MSTRCVRQLMIFANFQLKPNHHPPGLSTAWPTEFTSHEARRLANKRMTGMKNTALSAQASVDMQAAIGGAYVMDDGRSFWVDAATVREIMRRITPVVLAECERHRLSGEHRYKPEETTSA